MVKEKRVLPADVYDTLEIMALAYGGIAAGPFFAYTPTASPNGGCPVCAHGLLLAADATVPDDESDWRASSDNIPSQALVRIGVWGYNSDDAVRQINSRKNRPPRTRVSFKDWRSFLGIVRGD